MKNNIIIIYTFLLIFILKINNNKIFLSKYGKIVLIKGGRENI